MKKIINDNISLVILATLALGTAALVIGIKNHKQLNPTCNHHATGNGTRGNGTPDTETPATETPGNETASM